MPEIIGVVAVEITGDYSGLQSDFDAAVAIAVAKGATLGEAINAALKLPDTTPLTDALALIGTASDTTAGQLGAMSSALDAVATSAQNYAGSAESIIQAQKDADEELVVAQQALSTIQGLYDTGSASANDLARAAQAVQSAFDAANPAVETASVDAKSASDSFAEFATQMAAVAGALAFTDGLINFGEAALKASDDLTRADIALTTITGDAAQAEATIGGLRELGNSDGLAFPSLLTAATRMQQLLPAGANVVAELGRIADGAAIMGTNIEAASNAFDRIVTSGNASARTLIPIGLSLTSLADALNTVNPALDATADNAAKAFKALDPGDRITVLNAALDTLAGTANKIATETFGGQWQTMANQVTEVMAQIGAAITPVISDLNHFISTDIIPAVQAIVGAFRELPQPVQDVAVALALIAAAAVPIAGALGAVGLALGGLATLGESVGAALGAVGISVEAVGAVAAVAAPLILAFGAAFAILDFSGFIDGLVNLASAAKDFVSNLDPSVWSPITEALNAVKASVIDTAEAFSGWDSIKGIVDSLGAEFPPIKAALDDIAASAKEAGASFSWWDLIAPGAHAAGDAMNAAAADLNVYNEATKTAAALSDGFAGKLQLVFETMNRIGGADAVKGINDYDAGVQTLLTHQSTLTTNLQDSKNTLDILTQAFQNGTAVNASGYVPTMKDVEAASKNVNTAMSALGITVSQTIDQFTKLSQARPFGSISDDAAVMVKAEQQALAAHQATITAIAASGQTVHQFWANMLSDAQFSMAGAIASAPPLISDMNALNTAIQPVGTALKNLIDQATINEMGELGKAFHDFGIDLTSTAPSVTALASDLGVLEHAAEDGLVTWDLVETGIGKVSKAISDLSKTDLPGATAEFAKMTQGLIASDAPLSVIETELGKLQGYIQKLAKEDLPAAVDAQGKYIEQLGEIGAPISEIIKATEDWDKMQIQLAEDSGESASKYIVNLALMKQQTQDTADSIKNILGNAFVGLEKAWNDAFDQLGKSLADNIVAGKSWADTWHSFLQGVEKEILEQLIGVVFKALRGEIDSLVGSLIGSLGGALKTTMGGIGSLSDSALGATSALDKIGPSLINWGDSVGTATKATGELGSAASSAAPATTALGGATSAATSALTGWVSAISSAVGAIAGIAGDIEQAHANNLLGEIEVNTRSAFNEITNLRQDAWSQFNGLFGRLGDIWGTLQAMGGAGSGVSEGDKNIVDSLASMGQTLLDIDTQIYNVLTTLQGGIGTNGKSSGTADLSGQSLAALNASVTALNGIWSDENLVVQGIQNLAIDIQALAGSLGASSSDFQKLFTNQSQTAASQIATITKQISDNNAQIALALASNNQVLADSLKAQNVGLQAQLDALNALKTSATATTTNTAATATNTAGVKETIGAAAEEARAAAQAQTEAIGRGLNSLLEPLNTISTNTGMFGDAIAALAGHIDNLGGELGNLAESAGRAAASGTGQGDPGTTVTTTPGPAASSPAAPTTGKSPIIPRKSFDLGGFNPVDQIVSLHANEWVIPPSPATIELPMDVLSRITMPQLPQLPGVPTVASVAGNGAHISGPSQNSNDTYNIVINTPATNPSDLVRQVAQEIKTRTGRTAKFSN